MKLTHENDSWTMSHGRLIDNIMDNLTLNMSYWVTIVRCIIQHESKMNFNRFQSQNLFTSKCLVFAPGSGSELQTVKPFIISFIKRVTCCPIVISVVPYDISASKHDVDIVLSFIECYGCVKWWEMVNSSAPQGTICFNVIIHDQTWIIVSD